MARFSGGLILFTRNYRGLGLPVLTTRFGEMARRGEPDGVYVAEEPGALAATLARAARPVDASDIDAFRRAHSWERRFADVQWFAPAGSE